MTETKKFEKPAEPGSDNPERVAGESKVEGAAVDAYLGSLGTVVRSARGLDNNDAVAMADCAIADRPSPMTTDGQ